MALISYGQRVSTAQIVTATAVSTNSMDLGQLRDIGEGDPVYLNFSVATTCTAGGSATVAFELISATDTGLTAGIVSLGILPVVAVAALSASTKVGAAAVKTWCIPVPPVPFSTGSGRYLGARFTVATGPLTAGAFNAYFGPAVGNDVGKFYPGGY